jgi:hypothetical protein
VSEEEVAQCELQPRSVRATRLGHGANCSSIGSVVDTLFASAVIGSAILGAVLAAMKKEPITVVGHQASHRPDPIERGSNTREGEGSK